MNIILHAERMTTPRFNRYCKFREAVKQTILILLTTLCFLSRSNAQEGWELGAWLGGTYYFGDLNTNFDLSLPGYAGGIIGRYNFNKRVAFKLSANYGLVRGDDAVSNNVYERARNLSFQSTILDGTGQLEFNFLPYNHGSTDEFFTPYLFAGLSIFNFNPKAEYRGELVELRPLGTEGQFKGEEYFGFSAGVVLGGGFKVDLSYEWSLNFEVSTRSTFTDYLDDVSTTYPDKSDLLRQRGELAVALSDRSIPIPGVNDAQIGERGTQRGDSTTKDSYLTFGIGLLYYFGDIRCPDYGKR